MKYLNLKEAIDWLNKHAQIGNANITINKRFMKMLEETGRLFPDKRTLFGRYYVKFFTNKLIHFVSSAINL